MTNAKQRRIGAGDRVATVMGCRHAGMVVEPFPWRESTDGTYRAPEPRERALFVAWDDGTRGWVSTGTVRRIEPV